jgi:hypothetical protein
MDRVVATVAERLPVSVNTAVTAVKEIGEQVEVQWIGADGVQNSERVDFCVIATPARDVPFIDKGLSGQSRDYLQNLPMPSPLKTEGRWHLL